MSNNLHAILSIQFDIFKHEEEEWNKIVLVSIKYCSEYNLQAILSIQFDIFKHEEEEWNKIVLVSIK